MTVAKPKALPEDLMTVPEVAWLTGWERGTVERWRIRNQGTEKAFPEADDYIGSTPVWRVSRVLAWLEETDRTLTHTVEEWRKHKVAGGFRRKLDGGPGHKA